MKNNNNTEKFLENEIDITKIFKTLVNSKKILASVTLLTAVLAFFFAFQKELKYESIAIMEIGVYKTLFGDEVLIEDSNSLIQALKLELTYRRKIDDLNFKTLEDTSSIQKLVEISYKSDSPEIVKKIIDEAVEYTLNRVKYLRIQLSNSLVTEIESLDKQIKFQQDFIVSEVEDQILTTNIDLEGLKSQIKLSRKLLVAEANQALNSINIRLPNIERKLKALVDIISKEVDNLLLLQSDQGLLLERVSKSPTLDQVIFNYRVEFIKNTTEKEQLILEKNRLENYLKDLKVNNLDTESILELELEKNRLENYLKTLNSNNLNSDIILELELARKRLQDNYAVLVNNENSKTKLMHLIKVNKINPQYFLTTLAGAIFGFIFSVFFIITRQFFLQEENY